MLMICKCIHAPTMKESRHVQAETGYELQEYRYKEMNWAKLKHCISSGVKQVLECFYHIQLSCKYTRKQKECQIFSTKNCSSIVHTCTVLQGSISYIRMYCTMRIEPGCECVGKVAWRLPLVHTNSHRSTNLLSCANTPNRLTVKTEMLAPKKFSVFSITNDSDWQPLNLALVH